MSRISSPREYFQNTTSWWRNSVGGKNQQNLLTTWQSISFLSVFLVFLNALTAVAFMQPSGSCRNVDWLNLLSLFEFFFSWNSFLKIFVLTHAQLLTALGLTLSLEKISVLLKSALYFLINDSVFLCIWKFV